MRDVRPPPIRTDGSNGFARYSMQQRVPAIAREVAAHNPHFSTAVKRSIEQLARDIEGDAPLPAPCPPGPDVQAWTDAHVTHAGETWLATEWFNAEFAFYRELVRCCRFWETGRDPFAWAKEEELGGDGPWARVAAAIGGVAGFAREERVASLMHQSLWGNRVDLSYRVAATRTHVHDEDLLADDTAAAARLLASDGAHVHVVADNTGTELALDLALVDALLEDERTRVTVHVKMQPVFVSDATPADVWRLLDCMRAWPRGDVSSLADRLCARFDAERLVLAPDPFWSGPRFLWEAPPHLRDALASATIVVLKGDANYRRLVGDALWPPHTKFSQPCAGLPFPVVCLRTMKSDSILGLPPGLAEQLDATEPRWRIDGKRGVIQAYIPA
jgi:hypothetical protein